ncbi:hypothetical protein [Bacillus phage SWEP1]|nr:hypothetical protein [Bacillus phage SWEP1]
MKKCRHCSKSHGNNGLFCDKCKRHNEDDWDEVIYGWETNTNEDD